MTNKQKQKLHKFFGDLFINPETKRKSKDYTYSVFERVHSEHAHIISLEQIELDIECGLMALSEANKLKEIPHE